MSTTALEGAAAPEAPLKVEGDLEISTLTHLIEVTAENLGVEKELLGTLGEYKSLRKAFTADRENKKKADVMIISAVNLLKTLEKHYLTHLFTEDFIEELEFFAQFSEDEKNNNFQRAT